jgi:hypothetical protein
MFGQNVMKPMTKEDAIQIANARNFLVPLNSYRNQLKLKPDLNKINSFPENSHVNVEALQIRLEQQKQEEQLSKNLMRSTLEDMIEANKIRRK